MDLAKYKIDIAALCETRFSESGDLNDLEYSFVWCDKPEGERREAGLCYHKGYRHKADRNATASKRQNHDDETTSEQGPLCYNYPLCTEYVSRNNTNWLILADRPGSIYSHVSEQRSAPLYW